MTFKWNILNKRAVFNRVLEFKLKKANIYLYSEIIR